MTLILIIIGGLLLAAAIVVASLALSSSKCLYCHGCSHYHNPDGGRHMMLPDQWVCVGDGKCGECLAREKRERAAQQWISR